MRGSTGHSSGLTALIGRVLTITAGAAILAWTVITTPVDGRQGDVDVPFGVNGLAVMRGGNQPVSLGVHLTLSDTGVIAMAGSAGNLDDSAVILNPSGGIASVLSDELGTVVDVATTVDDRTVVASNRSVHRWMPDGSPDTAFGAGGEVNLNPRCACWIVAIDVDASGRVVVVGERGISQLVIVRLLENGQFDRSFATDGMNEEIPFGIGFYRAMAVAPDGATGRSPR